LEWNRDALNNMNMTAAIPSIYDVIVHCKRPSDMQIHNKSARVNREGPC
jgi:hypothetical protein